jgi:hypothetical protein
MQQVFRRMQVCGALFIPLELPDVDDECYLMKPVPPRLRKIYSTLITCSCMLFQRNNYELMQ